tara:strand:+ start:1076 stop:1855 length:780 start_codon:yes stop_codon:yes gene_type:complete
MPRPSPKMERIYAALEQGWPGASINSHDYDRFVLWGLIGNNVLYTNGNYIFCDMPYHGRYDPNNEQWDETYWRWCYQGLHDNRKLDVPSDRFESWGINIKPWQRGGEYILICPSSETMTFFMHGPKNVNEWIEHTTNEIKQYTDRPIKVRLKPRKGGTSGPSVADIPIESDLAAAHCVVVSGSICAVDALAAGVPVFSTSDLAPTAWCTNRDFSNINNPQYYDREHLFYNLAYKQYSIKEMREGICYENSMRFLNNQSK